MIKSQTVSVGVAVGLLVLLSSNIGCGDDGLFGSKACTQAGCSSGSQFSVPVALSFAELTSKTLEFCRNDACITTSLAALSPPGSDSFSVVGAPDRATLERTPSDSLQVSLARAAAGSALGLSLDLQYSLHDKRTAREGDRYRVRLLGADGGAILLFDKTARYLDAEPNGPGCGPVCKVADF
ncbi:MAG: hypothetical protein RLZZ450_6937 [Pseudomonadota bacterium]|jgi:hypothetical protein